MLDGMDGWSFNSDSTKRDTSIPVEEELRRVLEADGATECRPWRGRWRELLHRVTTRPDTGAGI
jgi:hypothetical protein